MNNDELLTAIKKQIERRDREVLDKTREINELQDQRNFLRLEIEEQKDQLNFLSLEYEAYITRLIMEYIKKNIDEIRGYMKRIWYPSSRDGRKCYICETLFNNPEDWKIDPLVSIFKELDIAAIPLNDDVRLEVHNINIFLLGEESKVEEYIESMRKEWGRVQENGMV